MDVCWVGPLPCLSSLEMPTAIVRIYAEDGFVIAADGLQLRDDKPFSDSLQKIFPIEHEHVSLAYALCGTTIMTSERTGEPVWNLEIEMAGAIKSLSGRESKNLAGYARRLSTPIIRRLEEATRNGHTGAYADKPTIADILIDGYYKGVPSRVRVGIYHRDQKLATPEVVRDSVQMGGYHIHGSKLITASFFDPDDQSFAGYGKPGRVNGPMTLAAAIEIAAGYIRACSSPQALQMDRQCAGIGGHIHIATITPKDGFRWVPGYEPL